MNIFDFINFYIKKFVFQGRLFEDKQIIEEAFNDTVEDFRYHLPKISEKQVACDIIRNSNGGLPVFLYRLVRRLDLQEYDDDFKYQIHFLMKILCGCEIYWSTKIGVGFHIDHGFGTVIGSRSSIGKGFWMHHGCTIGHKNMEDIGLGPEIGDDVIVYANSQVLGSIKLGNKVVVAANSLVICDVEDCQIVGGSPSKVLHV